MGSKLVFHRFRNVGSKLVSKTPIQSYSSSLYNRCKFSGSPSFSSKFGYLNVLKQNESSLLSGVSRRYYYADLNQFNPFKLRRRLMVSKTPIQSYSPSLYNRCKFSGCPSFSSKFGYLNVLKQNESILPSGVSRRYYYAHHNEFNPLKLKRRLMVVLVGSGVGIYLFLGEWLQNHSVVLNIVLVGFGAVISFYAGSIGVVPYTKRMQFRIVSKTLDRFIGSNIKEILEAVKWKTLPTEHPDSVRVRRIGNDIFAAFQLGLTNDQVSSLGGLNWEVLVVDRPNAINARYIPGGKIIVFTGWLKEFQSDPEIATAIGHEFGHALGLHYHEKILQDLWRIIIYIGLYLFLMPPTVKATIVIAGVYAMYTLYLRIPLWRKWEFEADYIGMMVMALAGYDPRVAPNVYERRERLVLRKTKSGQYSLVQRILSRHPSAKQRAQMLGGAMEEALSLYRQTSHVVLPTEKNEKRFHPGKKKRRK